MGGNIELSGSISAGGSCGGCDEAGSANVIPLSISCRQAYSGAVVRSDKLAINAQLDFVDLPLLEQLATVEFLYLRPNTALTVRLYAAVAELVGSGGVFPTGFVGGETLTVKLEAFAPFTAAFLVGDQTAAQVAARINAAAMVAGIPWIPASVDTSGQVKLVSQKTGSTTLVQVTGGTAQAALGFAAGTNDEASGSGSDLVINGTFLVEFDKTTAPERIQVKGISTEVTLMAAGPSASG